MTRVGVVGATGYAGAELVRILAGHPDVDITTLISRQYAGHRFADIYPSMAGVVDLRCDPLSLDHLTDRTDVVFTALPHKIPMSIVPELVAAGKKVVDLSADFRFKNASTYERYYEPHTASNLLEKAVYGLSEIYADEIRRALIIGNPGCYPTSLLLPLIPLVRNKLLQPDTIIADAKSGVSGAGRSLSLTSHYCEVEASFKAYKVAEHRHNPEMEEILSREAGISVEFTFVPHLVPMSRGMLTTIYVTVEDGVGIEQIRATLKGFYAASPFIRLCAAERTPDTRDVRGSNYCDIGIRMDTRTNRLILISAIDNLVKGAAGQAVQNMNIMLGLDETAGLTTVPYPV
jgi:N-acetyl-gamma-glutamyl-phosphate reductase